MEEGYAFKSLKRKQEDRGDVLQEGSVKTRKREASFTEGSSQGNHHFAFFDYLPDELVALVLLWLPPHEILRVAIINHRFRDLALGNGLWKNVCGKLHGENLMEQSYDCYHGKMDIAELYIVSPVLPKLTPDLVNWKMYYRFRKSYGEVVDTLQQIRESWNKEQVYVLSPSVKLPDQQTLDNKSCLELLYFVTCLFYNPGVVNKFSVAQTEKMFKFVHTLTENILQGVRWRTPGELSPQELPEDILIQKITSMWKECFKNTFDPLLHLMAKAISSPIQIATYGSKDQAYSALEALQVLSATAPAAMRQSPRLLHPIFRIIANRLLECISTYNYDNWETIGPKEMDHRFSEILDSVARNLGGKATTPLILDLVMEFFNSDSWAKKCTALEMVFTCGEWCGKVLFPYMNALLDGVVRPAFAHSDPRVRWTACHCVGQLAADFQIHFQKDYHQYVLPALLIVLENDPSDRVKSHAAAAVVNFCEECPVYCLSVYLDPLLNVLSKILNHTANEVLIDQCIAAVASIADCSGGIFAKHYDTFVPLLNSILSNPEKSPFHPKAMECLSFIAISVEGRFKKDANDVMQILQSIEPTLPANKKPFLFQAWGRICKSLRTDFSPYLPFVMPRLIRAASADPDIRFSKVPEEMEEYMTVVNLQNFPGENQQFFGINSVTLEDKETACNMIFVFCEILDDLLFPYLDQLLNLVVRLLVYRFSDDVRGAAISTVPLLIKCLCSHLKKHQDDVGEEPASHIVTVLGGVTAPLLSEMISPTITDEMLECLLESVKKCISNASVLLATEFMTANKILGIINVLSLVLQNLGIKRSAREARMMSAYFDSDEEKFLGESKKEADIFFEMSALLGVLFRTHPETCFGLMSKLMPIFAPCLDPGKIMNPNDLTMCVCFIDDFVEWCGGAGLPITDYSPKFLPCLLKSCAATVHPVPRQSALYSVGIYSSFARESEIPEILAVLEAAVNEKDSKSVENIMATENAISSMGRVVQWLFLHSDKSTVDIPSLVSRWLSYFPITQDKEELGHSITRICEFIHKFSMDILGPNVVNTDPLMKVLAESICNCNHERSQDVALCYKYLQEIKEKGFFPAEQFFTRIQDEKDLEALIQQIQKSMSDLLQNTEKEVDMSVD